MENQKEKKNTTERYDIMTSCDNNLIQYVTIQLYSISRNLKPGIVHYYLFHRNIPDKNLKTLEALCHRLGNIIFHAVKVPEAEKYDVLANYGGNWCGEAYYSLCSHRLLPENVKRVLYVDAGDVIFTRDISLFYHSDFEGKALIVTPSKFKECDGGIAPILDLNFETVEGFYKICKGLFNSGAYLINLEKLRDAQLTIDDWLDFSRSLCERSGRRGTFRVYWGDQGLLSAAFSDDLKFYGCSQGENIWRTPYIPYNFHMGYYYKESNESPDYCPAIVHFVGGPKPWRLRYPIILDRLPSGELPFDSLKIGQAEWYYLWHEYAISTDRILREMGY